MNEVCYLIKRLSPCKLCFFLILSSDSEYSLIPIFHDEVCQACLRIFSRKYIRYSSPVSTFKSCHESLDNTFWGKLLRLFIISEFLLNLNLFHEIPALVSLKFSPHTVHKGKVRWTFDFHDVKMIISANSGHGASIIIKLL